ncbi:TetR/AcrR family transcriptional regulator [Nitratireductor sp. GCM10026969]|uniref:TetR/AcrR family transcriptional regulator n=1 Tax=Nitratireductor sp. GCM10026969 TaxID=3252645 RepID=UPI00362116A3
MPTRARERLIETAEKLFYAEGIQAVGLERLLSVSGVGRASFYRHFASKDDLVVTMLRGHDRAYREWLETRVRDLGGDPLAVFDALAERSDWSDYRGCAFINAMAEIADPASPVFRIAKEHKRAVAEFLGKCLVAAGYRDAETLAPQLVLLIDGATVTALHERTNQPMREAKEIARGMLWRSNDALANG